MNIFIATSSLPVLITKDFTIMNGVPLQVLWIFILFTGWGLGSFAWRLTKYADAKYEKLYEKYNS